MPEPTDSRTAEERAAVVKTGPGSRREDLDIARKRERQESAFGLDGLSQIGGKPIPTAMSPVICNIGEYS